jgi:hypothetical protein
MPVSKKRKRAGKEVVRQPVELPVRDTSKRWSLKIKPSQLIYLKDDPDFLTMVKFGRAIIRQLPEGQIATRFSTWIG